MRKKTYIIANWKMKLSRGASLDLAKAFEREFGGLHEETEIILCPSFVALFEISKTIQNLRLGAQNLSWIHEGALTGEISPRDLIDLGCKYVIIGHSERRLELGETEEMVAKKVSTALEIGLIPIVCIGETWEELNNGQRDLKLMRQIHASFSGIKLLPEAHVILAYEPIWAIGTGKNITPEDAFSASDLIRHTLRDFFSEEVIMNQFSVVYGGSVNKENAAQYCAHDSVEGVLVGGASTSIESFKGIVEALKK